MSILLGLISLFVWMLVFLDSRKKHLFGWASPTALFAVGLLMFYIVPSLYWQFRSWQYPYFNSYVEGLYLVYLSLIVFSIPFFIRALRFRKTIDGSGLSNELQFSEGCFGGKLWVIIFPVVVGIGWRLFLVTIGWQARNAREIPSLMGSEDLAFIILNFTFYYPICYYLLILCGNRSQKIFGVVVLVFDGVFSMFLLSRHTIVQYLLFLFVFLAVTKYKITRKQWVFALMFVVFVFSVVGVSQSLIGNYLDSDRSYVTPATILKILKDGTRIYYENDYIGGIQTSVEINPILRNIDDTMFRFYDARSLSATMLCIPETIPYAYGDTFKHIVYSIIPRYIWKNKPDLLEIHQITDVAMYPLKYYPLGTLGEFYWNGGFIGILLGGIVCFLICSWFDKYVAKNIYASPLLICSYPLFSQLLIISSHNFSQRIAETIHLMMVMGLIASVLFIIRHLRS